MLSTYLRAGAALLLAVSLNAGQADQVAGPEKERNAQQQKKDASQKEKAENAVADLMGGPHLDAVAVERGRKIFIPTCGFCHGNDAHGKSGPDLVRSVLVLHDNKGDAIGPVIRNGRPNRGMPAFSSLPLNRLLISRLSCTRAQPTYQIVSPIRSEISSQAIRRKAPLSSKVKDIETAVTRPLAISRT
jgi:mono/diheme cytochrome c family protein